VVARPSMEGKASKFGCRFPMATLSSLENKARMYRMRWLFQQAGEWERQRIQSDGALRISTCVMRKKDRLLETMMHHVGKE
jgi:hypothetical protein